MILAIILTGGRRCFIDRAQVMSRTFCELRLDRALDQIKIEWAAAHKNEFKNQDVAPEVEQQAEARGDSNTCGI